jgi:superfamily II DNA or RNA helicase
LSVTNDGKAESFSSILEMLKQTKASYQSVIHNQEAMEYLLGLGCRKLAEIRTQNQDAGGLVVASTVQHAQEIKKILLEKYQQTVSIVTYRHEEPLTEIERYRKDNTQWIVSVGMISEGTDIPRLQVCCHMSSVKTELYFRQVLGRILRVNHALNQQAWLLTFAEQSLIDFAERIEDDIPDTCIFTKTSFLRETEQEALQGKSSELKMLKQQYDYNNQISWEPITSGYAMRHKQLGQEDEIRLGEFKERVISAFVVV